MTQPCTILITVLQTSEGRAITANDTAGRLALAISFPAARHRSLEQNLRSVAAALRADGFSGQEWVHVRGTDLAADLLLEELEMTGAYSGNSIPVPGRTV